MKGSWSDDPNIKVDKETYVGRIMWNYVWGRFVNEADMKLMREWNKEHGDGLYQHTQREARKNPGYHKHYTYPALEELKEQEKEMKVIVSKWPKRK